MPGERIALADHCGDAPGQRRLLKLLIGRAERHHGRSGLSRLIDGIAPAHAVVARFVVAHVVPAEVFELVVERGRGNLV